MNHFYVLSAIEYTNHFSSGRKLVKLGFTKSVIARLGQLQTGNPYELIVEDCALAKGAVAFEKFVHESFAEYHYSGEWYLLPSDELHKLYALMDGVRQKCDCLACLGFFSILKQHRVAELLALNDSDEHYHLKGWGSTRSMREV